MGNQKSQTLSLSLRSLCQTDGEDTFPGAIPRYDDDEISGGSAAEGVGELVAGGHGLAV